MEETRKPGDHFLPGLRCADHSGGLGQLLVHAPCRDRLPGCYGRLMGSSGPVCFCDEQAVFGSFDLHPKKVWSEFVPFVACRAATGVFTMVAMIAMVDGLGIKQDFICKIVVSAISLVLNYAFSKWFIFKKES